MESEHVNSTITERNSFLVHPFVPEPGAQNQCTSPPHFRLPQFSEVSSFILSRMKGTDTGPQSTSKADDALIDERTLFLPGDFSNGAATGVKYVYDNDDSFETAGIDFWQESIPFRASHEQMTESYSRMEEVPEVSKDESIEGQRKSWLDALPGGVRPAKPELVGFCAGTEASASALTTYFSNKRKTDLLNILSFCDQLEPQLLVDVFVSIAKRHPGLPIFDNPNWEERVREQEAANAAALAAMQARAKAHQRPRHGHTLLNPRMRQRRKGVRKVVIKFTTTTTTEAAGKTVVVQEEETEDEEVLPPTWRKAGEGLYATLPPEDMDTLYLADDGDDEAFSHFLVDGVGNLTALAACG